MHMKLTWSKKWQNQSNSYYNCWLNQITKEEMNICESSKPNKIFWITFPYKKNDPQQQWFFNKPYALHNKRMCSTFYVQ